MYYLNTLKNPQITEKDRKHENKENQENIILT